MDLLIPADHPRQSAQESADIRVAVALCLPAEASA